MDAILCVRGKSCGACKPEGGFLERVSSYTAVCAQCVRLRRAAATRIRSSIPLGVARPDAHGFELFSFWRASADVR